MLCYNFAYGMSCGTSGADSATGPGATQLVQARLGCEDVLTQLRGKLIEYLLNKPGHAQQGSQSTAAAHRTKQR